MYPTSHSFSMVFMSNPSNFSPSSHILPTPSTSHISEILTLDSDSPPDSPAQAEETTTPSSSSITTMVLQRSPDQQVRF
jgi:hypothetical protein